MSVIRAFIAIELPAEIQLRLDQISKQLKQALPQLQVRWVPTTNMHLTLKFLGDVSELNLSLLNEMLLSEISNHHPFELSVGGLGAYPNLQRPRVVWVGVEAPAELMAVQNGIENRTAKLGYAREERPFSPHLTLGRVSRNTSNQEARQIGEVLQSTKVGFLGAVQVEEIRLFQSVLKPGGAEYTSLFCARLGNKL